MTPTGALLAIGGPTASGKTDLAIALAERLGGEIVNADSRQIYRRMDIGTAKPSSVQRAAVPHHLLDIVEPDEPFTLALYVRQAHTAIAAIQERGRLPILVGGTGLYLRAVTRGYAVPEVPPDPTLRAELEARAVAAGPEALLAQLRELDPETAARIDPHNVRRLIRALEVTLALGRPFSQVGGQDARYHSLTIVLSGERARLYARADARLDAMLTAGFEEEVAALIQAGYGLDLPALSALGYREIAAVQRGELSREAALDAVRFGTHAFIRRQLTWFRREPEARELSIDDDSLARRALDLAARWLEPIAS